MIQRRINKIQYMQTIRVKRIKINLNTFKWTLWKISELLFESQGDETVGLGAAAGAPSCSKAGKKAHLRAETDLKSKNVQRFSEILRDFKSLSMLFMSWLQGAWPSLGAWKCGTSTAGVAHAKAESRSCEGNRCALFSFSFRA